MSVEAMMVDEDDIDKIDLNSDYHRGYKVGYEAATSQQLPDLPFRTTFMSPVFIIDDKGVGWWIDPSARKCEKV